MDLAEVLNLPSRALSLNGTLGLAFGSRGKGGKNAPLAHYEHEKVLINLTKKNGAGSLGHEWFHSLDNYFGRQETGTAAMITGNINGSAPRHVSAEIMAARTFEVSHSEDSWQQTTASEIEDIKAAYDYLFDSIRFIQVVIAARAYLGTAGTAGAERKCAGI